MRNATIGTRRDRPRALAFWKMGCLRYAFSILGRHQDVAWSTKNGGYLLGHGCGLEGGEGVRFYERADVDTCYAEGS
jgi:hypothetical protein